jgi:hypothetical protein
MKVGRFIVEVPFPWKAFLKQMFFSPLSQVVWNPSMFWFDYKIQRLEECWMYDPNLMIEFLERCWTNSVEKT